jgi:hypothetical protein
LSVKGEEDKEKEMKMMTRQKIQNRKKGRGRKNEGLE